MSSNSSQNSIYFHIDTLMKGMNSIILPAMG